MFFHNVADERKFHSLKYPYNIEKTVLLTTLSRSKERDCMGRKIRKLKLLTLSSHSDTTHSHRYVFIDILWLRFHVFFLFFWVSLHTLLHFFFLCSDKCGDCLAVSPCTHKLFLALLRTHNKCSPIDLIKMMASKVYKSIASSRSFLQ